MLVSAYACEPGKGSEPYVGWTWVRSIARTVDEVHVITRANNRGSIEEALQREPQNNLQFHYFDLPGWMTRLKNKIPGGEQAYYALWQRAISRLARDLHKHNRYDLVHHLTFATMLFPPGVAAAEAPFIWGPVGGTLRVPHGLRRHLGFRNAFSESLHDLLIVLGRVTNARIARNPRTRLVMVFPGCDFPWGRGTSIRHTCNIYLDGCGPLRVQPRPAGEPLKLVTLGRLIYLKGIDLGIEALAMLSKEGFEFRWTIVGDGPEDRSLQALAERRGIANFTEFVGWIPREEALKRLDGADALLHPSYREGCGLAVLESMAAGLPVVCLNWGGPGYIVDDESGIKVPAGGSREEIIRGLAAAIKRLYDPELRRRMGAAARRRVDESFSSCSLGQLVLEAYMYASARGLSAGFHAPWANTER